MNSKQKGPHQWFEAFWRGERPEQIPYSIYWWEWRHTAGDPAWNPMYEDGLLVSMGAPTAFEETNDVTYKKETYQEQGDEIERQIMQTSVGEIFATWRNGWHESFWLEGPEDYRVLRHIVENTTVTADYEAPNRARQALGEIALVHGSIPRTPLQTILVDYAGLQNFAVHLLMYEEEVRAVYDALLRNFRKHVEIAAKCGEFYISCLENFTAETLGPERYKDFLLPVYEECFPMLHEAGKIVGTHYDGRIASCRDVVALAPIDLIESLTGPPEGDMTLAEARQAWPEKLFWSNINVSDYQLPAAELRAKVLSAVEAGAPDGRRLAFEVSEHIPQNWADSIPVVLRALKETRH